MKEPDAWKYFIDSTELSQSMHRAFTWGVVRGSSTSNDIWPTQESGDVRYLGIHVPAPIYLRRHLISYRTYVPRSRSRSRGTVIMIHFG